MVGCIVGLYLFELLIGFAIYCSKVCHISESNIEAIDIMKVVISIEMLEVLTMKSRVYDKALARI